MHDLHNSFIGRSFLRSIWALDYEAFKDTDVENGILSTLRTWSQRKDLKETSAEAPFLSTFFHQVWGYGHSGQDIGKHGFTLYPKYPVAGSGEQGGTGAVDLAIGWFDREGVPNTAQVLCEFKDIHSSLDAPQKGRRNKRSPVKQCLDYLSAARRNLFGNESVVPTWGIVTDMNEFRLYWYDRAPLQFLRFVIQPTDLFHGQGLLSDGDEARFERFLFWRIFHRETLLTTGGRSLLAQLIAREWIRDKEIENEFYSEYRKFREKLYLTLREANPSYPGTNSQLVRLAQKILDRCIFMFFCEDMGHALRFPPQLLRDFLVHESRDRYFDANAHTIWERLKTLFNAMNEGKSFGGRPLNQFNGGLFASDSELESLVIPNGIFCKPGQGQNLASLYSYKDTLLYLSAAYNYASEWSEGVKPLPSGAASSDGDEHVERSRNKNVGLYTLGRIFEQSITELEILEAEADGLPSLNKESKRKREGVYYTPEWVVERIVKETIGRRLADLKDESGWRPEELPTRAAIETYAERLKVVTVLDPACGSGAFLITALRYLLDEWHMVQAVRREVTGKATVPDDPQLVRQILQSNLYGVDINAASVEITQLALWLHTARSDRPLSSLDHTITAGNTLIDSTFYTGQVNLSYYDDVQKERVNTFDWAAAFPEVFKRGGFDIVISNPPYVKLQNFRNVHPDMAAFLREGRVGKGMYESTQSGNFDLYLPFIEKGIGLLNEHGRMGYIAPSLWTISDYGAGLRRLVERGKYLDAWIDFRAFQVFEEATTYTALQFYSREGTDNIRVAIAADGHIAEDPWIKSEAKLSYKKVHFGDRWLLLTGPDRALIDSLYERCDRLDETPYSCTIYQGLITSADHIYHLKRLGSDKYVCSPKEKDASPYQVELEDELMKPLVSGSDAKRYVEPRPATFLLFPYQAAGGKVSLLTRESLVTRYPKAWKYLKTWEADLRRREAKLNDKGEIALDKDGKAEHAPFDDDEWYRFGRNQNLDKQDIQKLIVAQTVPSLRVCFDNVGNRYINNVRVNGISTDTEESMWFLLGMLNGKVCNFVFKRIAKVKAGGYFEANKQFIAPLPIPKVTDVEQERVVSLARMLQELHTQRRDLLAQIGKRLETVRFKARPEAWLFPRLPTRRQLGKSAPANLTAEEQREWAAEKASQALLGRYDEIGARLFLGAVLDAKFEEGELFFLIDGVSVLDHIFVNDEEGAFIVAQWRLTAQNFSITDKSTGKKLCNALRKLAVTENAAVVDQIIELEGRLAASEVEIAANEHEMNTLAYKLYRLSDEEIDLVEKRSATYN